MNGYTPQIIASMVKAAYLEGAAVERSETPIEDQWQASKARVDSVKLASVMEDPDIADRLLSLYRLWANKSPAGTTPEESWKAASRIMKQIHDLVGDPPLDFNPHQETAHGQEDHGHR